MSQNNPLSTKDIEGLRETISRAKEALDSLVDYERAGMDVTEQRDKLKEVIERSEKILKVWGN